MSIFQDQASLMQKARQQLHEKVVNPYAVGMSVAMKSTGDKPPLEKSTITKAHKIAKKVEKAGYEPEGDQIDEVLGGQSGDGYIGHPRLGIKNPLAKKQTSTTTSSNTGIAGRLGNRASQMDAAMQQLRQSYEPEIINHLIENGFAETEQNAINIMNHMSESWMEEIVEARAEEKRGLGSTGAQRQRQKKGVVTSSGEVAHPATSYSGGQNPHLRGKGGGNKEQRRSASRRYVDQPGGVYAKPENKQGEGRYAKMQAKKRDQSHMSSRFD